MSYNKIRIELKELAKQRAGCRCEYCLSTDKYSTQDFESEHIVPVSKRGKTILENIAYACRGCNNHKFNKIRALDFITGKIVPLFNPRKHRWQEHFAWDSDPLYMVGLTPIGRATIDALQLNRPKLLSTRGNLLKVREHPPVLEN